MSCPAKFGLVTPPGKSVVNSFVLPGGVMEGCVSSWEGHGGIYTPGVWQVVGYCWGRNPHFISDVIQRSCPQCEEISVAQAAGTLFQTVTWPVVTQEADTDQCIFPPMILCISGRQKVAMWMLFRCQCLHEVQKTEPRLWDHMQRGLLWLSGVLYEVSQKTITCTITHTPVHSHAHTHTCTRARTPLSTDLAIAFCWVHPRHGHDFAASWGERPSPEFSAGPGRHSCELNSSLLHAHQLWVLPACALSFNTGGSRLS